MGEGANVKTTSHAWMGSLGSNRLMPRRNANINDQRIAKTERNIPLGAPVKPQPGRPCWGAMEQKSSILRKVKRVKKTPNVSHSILSHPHFVMAVAAQFLYVAAHAGIFSFFINYMTSEVPAIPAS